MATPPRRFKDAIYEQLARIGKAVAAPKRLELLDLLCQGPRTVEALAQQAALSVANASQHLQVLRATRLVEATRKGLHVEYRLADDEVARFVVTLRGLAEARLAEVDQVTRAYVAARGEPEGSGASSAATSPSSTSARPRSTAPGTSRARGRSRWTSSRRASTSCRSGARSSPTAAARTA